MIFHIYIELCYKKKISLNKSPTEFYVNLHLQWRPYLNSDQHLKHKLFEFWPAPQAQAKYMIC